MTTVAERVRQLAAVPLFAGLSRRSLEEVARVASDLEARPGQVLVEPRQTGSGMFVVVEGAVEVGARARTAELGPGEFFGELALLTRDSKRTARVRAKTTVRCLAISRTDFRRLLEAHPRLAVSLLEGLAERLEQATR